MRTVEIIALDNVAHLAEVGKIDKNAIDGLREFGMKVALQRMASAHLRSSLILFLFQD